MSKIRSTGNAYLFPIKVRVLAAILLSALLPALGNAQDGEQQTTIELYCSLRCPDPIRICRGCQVTVKSCGPAALKQHSSVSWTTEGGKSWTVQFKGKGPCQQKEFDVQHPVCELTGQPGTYTYVAAIAGCARKIAGTFAVVQ